MSTVSSQIEWIPPPPGSPNGVLYFSKCGLYCLITLEFLNEYHRLNNESIRLREENKAIRERIRNLTSATDTLMEQLKLSSSTDQASDLDSAYDVNYEYDGEYEDDPDFT